MKKRFMSILLILCMVLNLMPTQAYAANNYKIQPTEGWYYIRFMGNYLSIDANGNAELRDKSNTPEGNTKFLVHSYGMDVGDATFGFEMQDGKYLGLEMSEDKMFKDAKTLIGLQLKALKPDGKKDIPDIKKYILRWNIYSDNNKDLFNIRPRMNVDYVVTAKGGLNADGTSLIIEEHADRGRCPAAPYPNAPNYCQLQFVPIVPAFFTTVHGPAYRDKPDGKIIGKFDRNAIVWVTEIDGDWAKIKYRGKNYYLNSFDINALIQTPELGVELVSIPSKKKYRIGDSFNSAGVKAFDWKGGVKKNITNKLTFSTEKETFIKGKHTWIHKWVVTKLKKGYKFKTTGSSVEVSINYKGAPVGCYWIDITK